MTDVERFRLALARFIVVVAYRPMGQLFKHLNLIPSGERRGKEHP